MIWKRIQNFGEVEMDKKQMAIEEIKWIASRLTDAERENMKREIVEFEIARQKRFITASEYLDKQSDSDGEKDA